MIQKILIDHFIIFLLTGLIMTSCGASRTNHQKIEPIDYSGALTIVYKTKHDYLMNVPVTLSADKSKIVSYPSVSDIFYKGEFAYPYKLESGYLLDNRGINENSVFLKYTYEEYSKLKEIPKLSELYISITDKDPFIEIYNCGNRYRFKNEIEELNELIKNDNLKNFKKLK